MSAIILVVDSTIAIVVGPKSTGRMLAGDPLEILTAGEGAKALRRAQRILISHASDDDFAAIEGAAREGRMGDAMAVILRSWADRPEEGDGGPTEILHVGHRPGHRS